MPAASVSIQTRESARPRSAPSTGGDWFVAGLSERGSAADAVNPITSMSDFETRRGQRQSDSVLYDAVEAFFKEGGRRVFVSRVFGPNPVTAFVVLNDAGAAATLRVEAKSPGSWANGATGGLKAQVLAGDAGGEFKIAILLNDVEVERTPSVVDKAAAIAWATNNSQYVVFIDQGANTDPAVVAATSLAGGTDDRANATDATWLAALNKFTKDLGPGQVSMPGRTTANAHRDTCIHAAANNRNPYLDLADTGVVNTLTAAVSAARALLTAQQQRFGGAFAPWVKIPGLTEGTTRTVPPSAVLAGITSRNDGLGYTANDAPAGDLGDSNYGIDLSQSWTQAERDTLADGQVNVIKMYQGIPRVYGFDTIVNPLSQPNYTDLANMREWNNIAALASDIGEKFVLKKIDGRGRLFNGFNGELTAMLLQEWENDALHGETPQEAFFVDTGDQVNTEATIAAKQIKAALAVKLSPTGKFVIIEVTKVYQTEEV